MDIVIGIFRFLNIHKLEYNFVSKNTQLSSSYMQNKFRDVKYQ